ncbi:hypothetical protein DPMN_013283 [Dreissena polymorpha]|uniref:Uncharacterized protein n=1 Tax=Dreissena polymorpha TaxID=45954 RepID=A0A9D4S470_DREPO|nr:hypothetical protein DPMN_013283 [Dreissena polymorpha]
MYVSVERGADVAYDHHLRFARLKLKLKRNWTGGPAEASVQHWYAERHLEAKLQYQTIQQVLCS